MFLRQRSPARRSRAFTLVELLVVITIIVMLIALLLPALVQSRVGARAVLCMSNLRNQSLALEAYRAENLTLYPMACDTVYPDLTIIANPALSWDDRALTWFLAIDGQTRVFQKILDNGSVDTIASSMNMSIFQCPEWANLQQVPPEDLHYYPGPGGAPLYGYNVPQYAFNQGFGFFDRFAQINGYTWRGHVRELNMTPAKAVTVIDALVPAGSGGIGQFTRTSRNELLAYHGDVYTFRPSRVGSSHDSWGGYTGLFGANTAGGFRHNAGAANRLFADGHATAFRKYDFDAGQYLTEFTIRPDVFPANAAGGYP
jgi:prepilin-type N-terminal cleavage/methylation domain-containing protein/prepilin-type processing-associated H-X9-DG protein